MDNQLPRYLKATEVAELLSISRSAVYKKIEEGLLPSVRIGGTVRVPAAALVEQLQRAERPAITSDIDASVERFRAAAGMSPHEYTEKWRAGSIDDTAENASLAIEALGLRGALDRTRPLV